MERSDYMNKLVWLSILEYAQYRDISISTVRRYIKARRVKFKLTNGRYLIGVAKADFEKKATKIQGLDDWQKEKKALLEEIDELKMLVKLYENERKTDQFNQAIK